MPYFAQDDEMQPEKVLKRIELLSDAGLNLKQKKTPDSLPSIPGAATKELQAETKSSS